MAKPNRPSQQRAVAVIHLLVVIVAAMAVLAPTAAAAGARRRVPPPPPALVLGYKVYCNEAHGVSEGETCASVARDAGISLSQFLELNQNINCGALFLGQWVCLHGVEVA